MGDGNLLDENPVLFCESNANFLVSGLLDSPSGIDDTVDTVLVNIDIGWQLWSRNHEHNSHIMTVIEVHNLGGKCQH